MKLTNFAFLDIETSGASLRRDRIIEIGILRVENGELVKTFQSLINPQTYISPFIEDMTGIRKNDLENAPLFSEIKDQILEIVHDCIFVAHNVRFDYGFIKKEFSYLGHTFSQKHLCTVKLSRLLYPQHTRHNLDEIINRFGFLCENRHRAFDDAKILWDFFQKAQQQFTQEVFEKAIQTVMKRPSLPVGLSIDTIDTLPETPGVYIFYGENNMPLYVGKSINLRERILSHFAADHTSPTEMKIAQQITHIETIPTAGELGALFKESMLVKQMQPLYNRKLRHGRKLFMLRKNDTSDGYHYVSLETVETINTDDLSDMLGIFTSKKQAEEFLFSLAKQHKLCHKLLGIEKTKSSCFMYRLGECKGACINKELPIAYNMRFIMAFSQKKIKPWPFTGPVAITEKNEEKNILEVFIVDKWCYISSASSSEDVSLELRSRRRAMENSSTYNFDLDLYKILYRYLMDKKNYKYVKVLKKENEDERTTKVHSYSFM